MASRANLLVLAFSSLKSFKESSLGLSNLSGTNNCGWVEDWGDWDVVSSNLFVSISVRFSHFSAIVSMFLFGRVNVLASVSNLLNSS